MTSEETGSPGKVTGLIVVDGANTCGKDFLVEQFRRVAPDLLHLHATYRFKKWMFTYHLALLRRALRESQKRLVIINRLWLSEAIYAQVYRGGSKWPLEGRFLDRLLLKHGAVSVTCLLDPAKANERYAALRSTRKEFDAVKNGQVAQLYKDCCLGVKDISGSDRAHYGLDLGVCNGMISRPDHQKYEIDIEGQPNYLPNFIRNIVSLLEALRESQYQPALDFKQRNITGHIGMAKVVMLGDRVNHEDYTRCWPFMEYANSSLYLTKALHIMNVPESGLMWTNADCEEEHLPNLLKLKPRLTVLALGNTAAEYAKKCGARFEVVPHPSHSKRFSNLQTYVAELDYALERLVG